MPYRLGFAIVFLRTFPKKIYFGMKSSDRGLADGKSWPNAPPNPAPGTKFQKPTEGAESHPKTTARTPLKHYAEKLSPQEQWATAFGFVTLNPPFWSSSEKSKSDPLTNKALLGSTTTRTPALSTIISRATGPSTRSILYCNPEHPPPITATRRAPPGRPCRLKSVFSFTDAASVTLISFSLPIL